MIHYDLRCSQDHAFDGWFKDSAAFSALPSVAWSSARTAATARSNVH